MGLQDRLAELCILDINLFLNFDRISFESLNIVIRIDIQINFNHKFILKI